MMLPGGQFIEGAVLAGIAGGAAGELFNPCMTEISMIKAMAWGGVGGLLGGATKGIMMGGRQIPLHVTDLGLIGQAVLPQSAAAAARQVGANVPGSYFGSD